MMELDGCTLLLTLYGRAGGNGRSLQWTIESFMVCLRVRTGFLELVLLS